jgi:glycosyltransferase involved in cell wall biosynthesis
MNVGGPALLIAEIIGGLEIANHEHTLITGFCAPNEIDYLTLHPMNSDVIYLDNFGKAPSIIADLKSLFRLIRVLRKLKPDIVHTHTSKAGLLGRIAAKLANPKVTVIHTYHGHLLYGYFSPAKVRFLIIVERALSKFSNLLVGVTYQVKNDLLKVKIGKPENWTVVYPGVVVRTPIGKKNSREQISVSSRSSVVTWIGRFTEIKDPQLALGAIAAIDSVFAANLTFIFVGDGELLEQCRQMAVDIPFDIRFEGWQEDVSVYLESSDLLLMTSRNEGMPVALLEAASFGVPTIAPDVGGIAEFINEDTGILAARDAQSFAQSIEMLLTNSDKLNLLGRNARTLFLDRFTVSQFVESHLRIYQSEANGN